MFNQVNDNISPPFSPDFIKATFSIKTKQKYKGIAIIIQ